jgi:hypothetical protein
MRAALGRSDNRLNGFAPSSADFGTDQLFKIWNGACTTRIRDGGHEYFNIANHKVIVKGESDRNIVYIAFGFALTAIGLMIGKRLAIDDSRFDIP